MISSRPSALGYCCAALMAAILLQAGAYAAPITNSSLAEIPLQGSNPVKPNIMYTMDESGSMAIGDAARLSRPTSSVRLMTRRRRFSMAPTLRRGAAGPRAPRASRAR